MKIAFAILSLHAGKKGLFFLSATGFELKYVFLFYFHCEVDRSCSSNMSRPASMTSSMLWDDSVLLDIT
jgi:hypothetical protein